MKGNAAVQVGPVRVVARNPGTSWVHAISQDSWREYPRSDIQVYLKGHLKGPKGT